MRAAPPDRVPWSVHRGSKVQGGSSATARWRDAAETLRKDDAQERRRGNAVRGNQAIPRFAGKAPARAANDNARTRTGSPAAKALRSAHSVAASRQAAT